LALVLIVGALLLAKLEKYLAHTFTLVMIEISFEMLIETSLEKLVEK